tara:strand:- start:143 stop:505 length:363 start_codon:yes stop_codon:yes gene_type:complete
MKAQAFTTKYLMLKELDKRVDGLDFNSSAFLTKFSFNTIKGETYLCPTAASFVESFNSCFGEIIDNSGTRFAGRGKYILTFLDKVVEVEAPKATPKNTTAEKPKPKAKPVAKKVTTVKEK